MNDPGGLLKEYYFGYTLTAMPREQQNGKWGVAVKISKQTGDSFREREFHAEDNIFYILEIEAAKEGLNLGRNLIDKKLVGF